MSETTQGPAAHLWPSAPDAAPTRRVTEPHATRALVYGILGLTVLPLICSIAAVYFGMSARRRIRDSRYALEGKGLADAGFALGLVGIAMGLFYAYIAFSRLTPPSPIPSGLVG
jgi:hypothetical protein